MEAQTKYAKSGDVHIAYSIFGEGPYDIILMPGTLSHVELYWELPANQYILQRLTSFARVIVFDKRGQGLSDRVTEQTLEERIGDVRAVLDAAGSKRATVFAWSVSMRRAWSRIKPWSSGLAGSNAPRRVRDLFSRWRQPITRATSATCCLRSGCRP